MHIFRIVINPIRNTCVPNITHEVKEYGDDDSKDDVQMAFKELEELEVVWETLLFLQTGIKLFDISIFLTSSFCGFTRPCFDRNP